MARMSITSVVLALLALALVVAAVVFFTRDRVRRRRARRRVVTTAPPTGAPTSTAPRRPNDTASSQRARVNLHPVNFAGRVMAGPMPAPGKFEDIEQSAAPLF
jgi:hypothetical protein